MANSTNNCDYHVLVKYEDTEQNEEIVPASYVKDLKPPSYQPNLLYDVFWSGDDLMTLEKAKSQFGTIKIFSAGAGYEGGVGYYKARILIVAESRKAVDALYQARRTRRLAPKLLLDTASSKVSSSGSTSSGVSSISDKRKRGRPVKTTPAETNGANKRRKQPEVEEGIAPSVFDEEELGEADSESADQNAPDQAVVPAKLYEDILAKYGKSKALAKQQQERIDKLHNQIEALNELTIELSNLNLKYQRHMAECRNSDWRPDNGVQPQNTSTPARRETTAVVNEDTPVPSPIRDTPELNEPTVGDMVHQNEAAQQIRQNVAAQENRQEEIDTAEKEIEIHPGLRVPESVWSGKFKVLTEKPLAGYKYGSEGDKKFVQDAAFAVWGFEVLSTHSVTGRASNANKKAGAEVAKPKLEAFKIDAIQAALKKRVLIEEQTPLPQGVEERDSATVDERSKIERVRFEIGQKIHAINKKIKRDKV